MVVHDIFENRWKLKIIEIESEADHLHIAFESNPQTQLSKLVNNFKTASSRYIQKEFKEQLKPYYWKPYCQNKKYYFFHKFSLQSRLASASTSFAIAAPYSTLRSSIFASKSFANAQSASPITESSAPSSV